MQHRVVAQDDPFVREVVERRQLLLQLLREAFEEGWHRRDAPAVRIKLVERVAEVRESFGQR